MAFLRRGNIRVPHRPDAMVKLTRIGNRPVTVYLKDISCWEEHEINPRMILVMMYMTNGSNFAVQEEFDAIDGEVNGKEVSHES